MTGNNGGPWGGGGGSNDDNDRGSSNNGSRRPGGSGGGQVPPELDDMLKKGREQLQVLMGGRGGSGQGGGREPGEGPRLGRGAFFGIAVIAVLYWAFSSFYQVQNYEKSVELFLGKYSETGEEGLNFAPWPFVTYEIIPVDREQTEDIGVGRTMGDEGLMLTGDENIVDIDFQVVWNVSDPARFLFNLREPRKTIRAVAESAMREIIAQSDLAPVLNRDRGIIADRLRELIQVTLDSYNSGVNVVRVNFEKADPPDEVIDAFRAVQAAEQQRDRLVKESDAYANRVLAQARGESAQMLEEAEGYRARVVNEATGEASRFIAVLEEYTKAPEVTRKRLYIETMEEVLGGLDKVIIDDGIGGAGIVPYLPLNQLTKEAK